MSIDCGLWIWDFGLVLIGFRFQVSGVRCSEKIERRTSNAQHRTSNNDGAALYLYKIKHHAEDVI